MGFRGVTTLVPCSSILCVVFSLAGLSRYVFLPVGPSRVFLKGHASVGLVLLAIDALAMYSCLSHLRTFAGFARGASSLQFHTGCSDVRLINTPKFWHNVPVFNVMRHKLCYRNRFDHWVS